MSVADLSPQAPVWSLDEVAPGVLRLDMPLPFRGLKQVNLWLLHGAEGWTMVDCGFGSTTHREMLEAAWRAALGGRPITRLVVTHFHPDHMGNAGFIARRWGLTPEMTQLEWLAAHVPGTTATATTCPPRSSSSAVMGSTRR